MFAVAAVWILCVVVCVLLLCVDAVGVVCLSPSLGRVVVVCWCWLMLLAAVVCCTWRVVSVVVVCCCMLLLG